MGKRGPKPRDPETEELLGNPRKQAIKDPQKRKTRRRPNTAKKKVVAITPAAAKEINLPQAPSFLSKEAREEWDRIVPQLVADGKVTAIHSSLLGAYCQAVGRAVQAEKAVGKRTHTKYADGRQVPKENLKVAQGFWNQAMDLWKKLALDKKKTVIDPPDDEDDEDDGDSDGKPDPKADPDLALIRPRRR